MMKRLKSHYFGMWATLFVRTLGTFKDFNARSSVLIVYYAYTRIIELHRNKLVILNNVTDFQWSATHCTNDRTLVAIPILNSYSNFICYSAVLQS